MRAGALRPSGSVWLATPGRGERDYPDADSRRMSRTHALAGGVKMGWRGFLLPFCEPLQVCLAVVRIWRQTGGRRVYERTQTATAACSPLGDTPSISRPQRGYCRRSNARFRCGSFPLIPTPVSASRTRPCAPCKPISSLAWRCCVLARHSHARIRDSSTQAWASVCGTSPVVRQSWQAQKGTVPRSLQC
jgi:hypothetical protein